MGTHSGGAAKAAPERTAEPAPRRRQPASPTSLPGDGGVAEGWQVLGTPELVKIASLVRACSPRSGGEDSAHVELLTEAEGPLPPILVHRATMQIIDGFHRVSAARCNGLDEIEAYLLDGPSESAFIVAVEANVTHRGLPLSLSDRRAAAARILHTHAHWSDRAIATSTGLSARTVSAMRCASAENSQLHKRLGKDGRLRPVNAALGRQLAAELLSQRPDASLREIAAAAGISPGTVRDVRERVARGDDPVATPAAENSDVLVPRRGRRKPSRMTGGGPAGPADVNPILEMLSRDPALRMSATGREVLRWLHRYAVNNVDAAKMAESVPGHCVEHLVELANRCSANWARIAHDLAQPSGEQAHTSGAAHAPRLCDLPAAQCS